MWHRVAPVLAETHTVVVPDLRGYGDSDRPPSDPSHRAYSKRSMAADQAGLMQQLGHTEYAVVGHDRGARVAHRLVLDHPDAVTRVALLDIAPTRHVFGDVDKVLALTYDHWFFLAQENDLPEVLIGGAAEHWLRTKLDQWSGPGAQFDEETVGEYVRCFDAGCDPREHRGLPRRRDHRPRRRRRELGRGRPDRLSDAGPLGRRRAGRPEVRRAGRLARVRRCRRARRRSCGARCALPARGGTGGDNRGAACVPGVTRRHRGHSRRGR